MEVRDFMVCFIAKEIQRVENKRVNIIRVGSFSNYQKGKRREWVILFNECITYGVRVKHVSHGERTLRSSEFLLL